MSAITLVPLCDACIDGGMTEVKTSEAIAGTLAIAQFFAKTKPEHNTSISIGAELIAKSNVYVFDQDTGLFEIRFFSKIANLMDLPPQYTNCLFVLANLNSFTIRCKDLDTVYIKLLPIKPILNIEKWSTYVEYAMPYFGHPCNVWLYYGMMVPRIAQYKPDGKQHCPEKILLERHKNEIEKYAPDAIILKTAL